ncbi:hypothetical protein ABZX77_03455 [Streptomyces sp. NPDC004237]|uniref:hypothetical protein n=1 Tax=Streptomyces sp. NPDC004237 TaxID=3154455 RepID=UPI00339E5F10
MDEAEILASDGELEALCALVKDVFAHPASRAATWISSLISFTVVRTSACRLAPLKHPDMFVMDD